jgi:hypothetical protein
VVAPAQLGALAAVDAGLGDLEPGVVRVARDGVELAAELGDPPGVGDVLRDDVQGHRRVRRDHHLLVRERVVERVVVPVGIRVPPDVLLAVDLDVERLAAGRRALVDLGGEDAVASCRPFAPVSSGLRMPGSWMKVTTASTMRITAAPTVQPTSRRVLPRICAATAPLRALNFTRDQMRTPSTPKKTTAGDDEHLLVEGVDPVGVGRSAVLRGPEVGRARARRRPGPGPSPRA